MSEPTKYLLPESEIPTHWVNLLADLRAAPEPPASPGHARSRSVPTTSRRSSRWG